MKKGCPRSVVTGGAGFIGSHLVDSLLAHNHDVLVIDDFSSGSPENLRHHQGNRWLSVETSNVCDERAMVTLLKGARYVFHLATRNVRLSLRQPTSVHDVNTTGTLNVLKAAAANNVERFLYCSSSEVNGTATTVPMLEDYSFCPETIYGASKLAGEWYTQVFNRSGWLKTTIARPHNTYGPREHYRGHSGEVIPRFILRALGGRPPIIYGDGRQTRDFTYVTETAEFLLRLLESEHTVGEVFNICRGQEVTIEEIASQITSFTGLNKTPQHRPDRPNDLRRLYGSSAKLRKVLGESPSVSISEGLKRTVEWFRENVSLTQELLASLEEENWRAVPAEPWMNLMKTSD